MRADEGFGARLRRLRIAAGLSQDRLADLAGVTAKTVRSLENDQGSRPRASTLGRVFDALDLADNARQTMLELLTGSQATGAVPEVSTASNHPNEGRAGGPAQGGAAGSAETAATEIAQALQELRATRGFTQRGLASRAGVHHRTISDLERGLRTSAQPGTAFRIAQAAGLRGDDLDRFVAVATGTKVEGNARPGPETWTGPEDLHGRVEEFAALLRLVSDHRFVAIIGPGGVGKTTLALAAAARPGSITVVELAGQPAGQPLTEAMAEALGTDGASPGDIAGALSDTDLAVLDNLEHLADVESTVERLLDDLPDLRLIVTSRRPVRAGGARGTHLDLGALDPEAAVSLLRQRAAEAGCNEAWVLDDQPYREICRRIDNLPLAIELAAAWSSLMSPTELNDRVQESIDLLDRRAGSDERHDSVRAMVGWTLGLLTPEATALFAELSVHPSSFTLALAEAVHGDADDLLDGMRELVDAAIVTVVGKETPTRFRILRVVREVGLERLVNADRHDELDRRRAAWGLELVSTVDAALVGPEQASWLHRLDLEREHLNLALDHLIGEASPSSVDLAAGLWRYWHLRGRYERGRDRLTASLQLRAAESAAHFGVALYGRGVLRYLAGDVAGAVDDGRAALDVLRARGDEHGVGSVCSLLGMIDQYRGEAAKSERWYRLGMELVSPRTAPRSMATLQTNLGSLLGQLGRLTEAIDLVDEAVARFETQGDHRAMADAAGNLALWELASGAPLAARDTLSEVLEVFSGLADPQGQADSRLGLVEAAMFLGDIEGARTELDLAAGLVEEISDPWGQALVAAHRSMLLLITDQREAALREARRARLAADDLGYAYAKVRAATVEAIGRAEQGRHESARTIAKAGLEVAGGAPIFTAGLALLVAGLIEHRAKSPLAALAGRSLLLLSRVTDAPLVARLQAVGPVAFQPAQGAIDHEAIELLRLEALELAGAEGTPTSQ